MINKIILYAILLVFVGLTSVVVMQKFKIGTLESNTQELENAVSAYEELLRVIPFNRMIEERSDNANEDINSTLNDNNAISDGTYRL